MNESESNRTVPGRGDLAGGATTGTRQYLTFHLGTEEYAVPLLRVREIIPYGDVTRVPKTPKSIRGVINLRGSVVPVVDLAVRFALPAAEVTRFTCIVIVETEIDERTAVLGLLVDSVREVVDLAASDIEPAPSFGTRVRLDDLVGMGRLGDRFALVLELDHVLSVELESAEQAAAAEAAA